MESCPLDPKLTLDEARDLVVRYAWRRWSASDTTEQPASLVVEPVDAAPEPLRKLLRRWPAEAVRCALLSGVPAATLPWDDEAPQRALQMLDRLYEARHTAEQFGGIEDPPKVIHALGAPAEDVWSRGRAFHINTTRLLTNGFDTGTMLREAESLASALNRFANHRQAKMRGAPVAAPALEALALLSGVLGLLTGPITRFRITVARKLLPERGLSPSEVQRQIDERIEARRCRDWARADEIRASLDASGILVVDGANGSEWRVRP